jgi:hypothetical protein
MAPIMRQGLCIAVVVAALAAAPLADVWDVQNDNDDSALNTDNELVHGSDQLHDLGARPGPAADQDWYRIGQKAASSYEVTLEGISGDVSAPPGSPSLDLIASDGTTVVRTASAETPALGLARSLRIANLDSSASVDGQFIRVANAACGTACTANDTYRIRMRETTINVARFNNSGTQITVLLTQNAATVPIAARIYFWTTTGTLAATRDLPALGAKALDVFNTASAAAGASGHITIAHDGPHGGLNVKSVALEPATGFSFDTPGVYKPF